MTLLLICQVVAIEVGCGVMMSKLRDKCERFVRVRRALNSRLGEEKAAGRTQHIRINPSHWHMPGQGSIGVMHHDDIPLPLTVDVAMGLLASG